MSSIYNQAAPHQKVNLNKNNNKKFLAIINNFDFNLKIFCVSQNDMRTSNREKML